MKPITRKRVISSCTTCYVKKQKCDRKYPCDHCIKRRRPDECVFQAYPDNKGYNLARIINPTVQAPLQIPSSPSDSQTSVPLSHDHTPLAERFGYLESSDTNILALVREFGGDDDKIHYNLSLVSQDDAVEVKAVVDTIPGRRVLDFLTQFFVSEVSWIDHLIHPPWFLERYRHWWDTDSASCVDHVEFLVLILRTCSYATQFLPCPYYTLDRINGLSLVEISKTCDEAAGRLMAIMRRYDSRGSWVRVQHAILLALKCQTEGRMEDCDAALSYAILVAQKNGMHEDRLLPGLRLNELNQEIRRRTYCYLYIWDTHLAKMLDRKPLLQNATPEKVWTKMQLVYSKEAIDDDDADSGLGAPDEYMERTLQARMATFWRYVHSSRGEEYDMVIAEEIYEQFCTEFIVTLPPSFALKPNQAWDKRHKKLPLLRQLLHISIFDWLCWHFRPLLLHRLDNGQKNQPYKRLLLSSQKRSLAVAALQVLCSVGTLHRLLGGSHTRFTGIITPTFEAAVILACLYLDPNFPDDNNLHASEISVEESTSNDPLHMHFAKVTRPICFQVVQDALGRLRMLAEVSSVAEVGAQSLGQLMEKMAAVCRITAQGPSRTHRAEPLLTAAASYDIPQADDIQGIGWTFSEGLDGGGMSMVAAAVSGQEWSYQQQDLEHSILRF
ncbi:hypothetical protein GGR51DRAFT_561312 [Nemania sp. FL0031]|nr:hypothetical protein GGR51DRAFT_561312 [Nemania sp. FL0031]